MCGHDWCALRISKEIEQFAAGKHAESQPAAASKPTPCLTAEQRRLLAKRAGKPPCHSDVATNADDAKKAQESLKTSK